jgi:tetratricopeptide (TPR) repeat protein
MKALVTVLLLLSLIAILPAPAEEGGDKAKSERLEKRMRLADELEAQGDDEGAVQILGEVFDADPKDTALLERIVVMLMRSERFNEAVPRLRQLLELKGGNEAEHLALARMMIEVKEHESAVEFIREAAERFPESADLPFLLTFALGNLERWDDAVAAFEETIALAKETKPELLNEGFYFRYAAAHERLKNIEEAEKLFRKTLELIKANETSGENPEFTATVLNYLAYMWIERGENLDEAGPMARDALELTPGSGAIADTVGWYHFQKGNYPRALVELKKAERLIEEPDPVILDHLGQTLAKLDEKEFAAEYFRKALELDPKNEELKARLDALGE